jgi:hypothetical protein
MPLSLSTLTSPSNNSVLEEINTTADFLEGVPLLKNAARGSNAGGSAKQNVALNQPRALPLIDGKGYCYLPVTTGNAPAVTFPNVPVSTNFVLTIVADIKNPTNFHFASDSGGAERFAIYNNQFYTPNASGQTLNSVITSGHSTFVIERVGSLITLTQNGVVKGSHPTNGSGFDLNHLSFNGQYGTAILPLNGYIQKATLSIGGTEQLNIDFNDSKIPHGASKFKCATNQVVTINTSGLDPAKIIKRPVLRFDGVNDFMEGVFNQTVPSGYLFAAFSVLGDGGQTYGRIFGINSTGSGDNDAGGFSVYRAASTNNIDHRYDALAGAVLNGLFDDAMGDVLLESSFENNSQKTKINNANEANGTTTLSGILSAQEFKIAAFTSDDLNPSIDLEFLALFSVDSVPDEATAKRIRDYINGRGAHPIYLRHKTDGYYFYDATKGPVGAIQSGSTAWSGRIVGSDNGDSATLLATQSTSNDAPVGDGFKVTFADNTDHLDIPSTTQAGWQIVGTSLGTFVYKVNNTAVTELNLLGNAGAVRSVGNSYGIILLPESATGADIEEARKLLIDRGAADASPSNSISGPWVNRFDIVEFKNTEFPLATTAAYAWENCNNMTTIGPVNAPLSTSFDSAWQGTSSLTTFPAGSTLGTGATNVNFFEAWYLSGLTSFPALDLSTGNNFTSAWKSCSSLTSFPAGAKLGTSASNVNFTSAWHSSGLTSFSTPLPTATNVSQAWNSCVSLSEFSSELPLVTNPYAAWIHCSSLTSFNTALPSALNAAQAWQNCSSLASFSAELPLVSNVGFAWINCSSLTDFSADVFANWNPSSIVSGVFSQTWENCSALSAQSVENILTSILASGQFATVDGNSGSAAIADPGIDIDYNAASGSLSAATNTAVSALKGRGWSIIVNNVTL